ncbi:unnamed protein product [Lactuca saligna]|uniref:Uncharacterized protein n=1 Tax=Lactuca saligna TaxID=75948 RepID=A0AA35UTV6_LACSI|nr:unnamed protein product [Lactuca saligna]CAI9264229.1 unnamed protein product [Lactuca saligna]CAI9264345.1 unnamed protein product [Lactuca saligna]CAI9264381.1 unnamed protein product [Lactuca saligna]CAI9264722.1 unnamed protein product [Lactuca saligna]
MSSPRPEPMPLNKPHDAFRSCRSSVTALSSWVGKDTTGSIQGHSISSSISGFRSSDAFCSSSFVRQRRRAIYLVATGSATLGSPYGATHRSLRSSESHCSGPRIPMSEVEQLRSRWSRLDPRMSPLSSLGVLTFSLLSQDTLPGCSLLTGLVILVIECSAQQFKGTGEVSGSALVE